VGLNLEDLTGRVTHDGDKIQLRLLRLHVEDEAVGERLRRPRVDAGLVVDRR